MYKTELDWVSAYKKLEAESNKRITDLEKENALLKGRNEGFEQQIMGLLIKYEEVYKRFPDLKSAMDKAQTILKENAELKTDYEVLSCSVGDFGELQDRLEEEQRKNNGLEEELKKWKDEWQEQVQKATDEGYARTLQTIQLTKATEIIKKFLLWENDWHDKTESKYELLKQAEQFISEVAK